MQVPDTREFARSDAFTQSDDVEWVVVRGRERTDGYGGRATLVTFPTGATR